MAEDQEETMELGLKVVLPRGVPVVAFVGMCDALQAIIRSFVAAVGLSADQVHIRLGPLGLLDAQGREGSDARDGGAGRLTGPEDSHDCE